MDYLNIEQIISFEDYPKLINEDCRYFNRQFFKTGLYYYDRSVFGGWTKVTDDYLNKNDSYVENNAVYYKPFIKIIMSSGQSVSKIFNTREELEIFLNQVLIAKLKTITY